MSAKAHNFKIGLFVLVAILGLLAILLLLGAGKLGKPTFTIETYINGSVQGLTVGSQLKLRGVPIGTVSDIDFSNRLYEEAKPESLQRGYVVVVMTVDAEAANALGIQKGGDIRDDVALAEEQGYRVRMTTVGITGNNFMEIDRFDPSRYPRLPFDWKPRYAYLPSAPPLLSSMADSVQEILKNLEKTDLNKTNEDLQALLQEATEGVKQLRSIEVSPVIQQANVAMEKLNLGLDDIRRLIADTNTKITDIDTASISSETQLLLQNLQLSNQRLQETLEQYQTLASSSVNPDAVAETLENLRMASANLRAVTEEMQANPSAVLLGEPPPPADRQPRSRR